eukprot:4799160-Pleurochrysis_carterae.AAC.1
MESVDAHFSAPFYTQLRIEARTRTHARSHGREQRAFALVLSQMISGVYYVRIPKARKADAPPRRKREKCDELEATSARTGDETGAKVSAKSGANIGAGTEATKGTCTTSPADDVDTSCKRFQERQTFNGSIELVDPRYSLRLHKVGAAVH